MATVTLKRLPRGILNDQSTNIINELIEEIEWILTGNLDVKNIKARGITAEKMKVDQLSAISADLGHIVAGLIEAVTIIGSTITGSLIQTSESSYPRAEMSTTDTMFRTAIDALIEMKIVASYVGFPSFVFTDGAGVGLIQYGPDPSIGANRTIFTSDNGILIQANTGDVDLLTNSGNTRVNSWSKLVNRATGNTLQTDLNAKANSFSGFTGSFSTGTQTVNVLNGVITSVM